MSFQPIVIGLAIVAWPFLVIALHEFAHLIVGCVVGLHPREMVIGAGPALLDIPTPIGRLKIRLIPTKGYVSGYWKHLGGLRWRGSVFALAGPATDALILALLFRETQGGTFFSWDPPLNQFLGVAIAAQAALLLANLLPQDGERNGKRVPNDGMQFLGYVTGSTGKRLNELLSAYRSTVARYDPTFTIDQCWIFKAEAADLSLLAATKDHHARREYDAVVEKYHRLLSTYAMSPGERALMLDQLACIPVMDGEKKFISAAIEWATEAHALLPQAKTIQGTLGSLLVESGKYAEGIALLSPLTTEDNEPVDRAMSACFLAKAHQHLGEAERTQHFLALAEATEACPAVCTRIRREIANL